MGTTEVTETDFEARVLLSSVPVLVDFWAGWCAPCKQIAPVLEEIAAAEKGVLVVRANVDTVPGLARKYGVRGVPTLILFRGGEVVATRVGAAGKEDLLSWLRDCTDGQADGAA